MKPNARESMVKALSIACIAEQIEISLDDLSDREVKTLYLKLQYLKSGEFPYAMTKDEDFQTAIQNGKLQRVSFRDSFKYGGIRRLTFNEFLLLCDFADKNPDLYTVSKGWRFH